MMPALSGDSDEPAGLIKNEKKEKKIQNQVCVPNVPLRLLGGSMLAVKDDQTGQMTMQGVRNGS